MKSNNILKIKLVFSSLIILIFIAASSLLQAQIKVSGQIGIQAPTGDFGAIEGNGFGITGTVEFYHLDRLNFTASIAYHSWGKRTYQGSRYAISYDAIPVLIGFRYYIPEKSFQPYFSLETGIYYMTRTQTDQSTLPEFTVQDNNSAFGFVPGIGVMLKIDPSIFIDVNLKYNTTTPSIQDGYVYPGSYVGINGGVEYSF